MHIVRTSPNLIRLVVTWFLLACATGVAAPMIAPQTVVFLCSQEGGKIVVLDDEGKVVTRVATSLDCPLCLPVAPPPPPVFCTPPPVSVKALPFSIELVSVHAPVSCGAPFPAHGPPLVG